MAPLDWKKIMSMDVEKIDEDDADAMYGLLGDFDPGDEDDGEKLIQLFRVTQAVLIIKSQEADLAAEEMEKMGKEAGQMDANQRQKYEDQIADLENELSELKRFGPATKDNRMLMEELREMEKRLDMANEDLKSAERDLRDEKQQGERYASRVEELEKENSDLKRDYEMAQDEIRDYRQQVDNLRERQQVRRGADADAQEKLQKKNRDLNAAYDEINELTELNEALTKERNEMAKNLDEARLQIEKTTNEYLKQKKFMQDYDQNIDDIKKQNELLKVRLADLEDQLEVKQSGDDEIMQAVNDKVEEWKLLLQEKDQELLDYYQQVRQLKEQIAASNIDSERTSIAVLTKAVEERDRQIRTQQDEIDQAKRDLDATSRIIESLRKDLQKSGKGPSDKHVLQIKDLNEKLTDMRERMNDALEGQRRAEDDAIEKDKALNDALEKMHQYELGEYGLSEAVDEIKALKTQVSVRDRQIGDLTQHVNKAEMKINDLSDENDQLREKLGIKPEDNIDLATYRHQKNTMKLQDRALNQVLMKEIEELEEERIGLKKKIRVLSQKTGQKNAALGILDDVDMDTGKRKKSAKGYDMDPSVMDAHHTNLMAEIDNFAKQLEKANSENAALKVERDEMRLENERLRIGLRDLREELKDGKYSTSSGEPVECPTLDKLVIMMETKKVGEDYNAVVYQRARADNLEGRVDELRKELRESRNEHTAMKLEVSKQENVISKLQTEIQASKDPLLMNRGASTSQLPKSMTATSAEIVASVNECLINVIQDVHLKEELLREMTEKVEVYKRKFAVVRHQLGTVYSDYLQEKSGWQTEKESLNKKIDSIKDEMALKETRLSEYDRLLDTLSQSPDEMKRRLAEESRKMAVARVNETNLTRRYNALLDIENHCRRENKKLNAEMIEMEITVSERVGYLLRYKEMSAFKIEHLHRELENSVPLTELDDLNKKHCELTEKYRDLLEKGNLLIAKKEELRALEVENEELKRFIEETKKMLEIEKEKSHVLETRLDLEGAPGHGQLSDTQASSISKKLTMLEMKELNERQRAEHAQRMFEQVRSTNHVLEARNAELEVKFADLTETVMQSQKTEQELRDQLDGAVSKAEYERQKSKLMEMESMEKHLRDEIAKLKQITEVSLLQTSCLDAQQVSRDKEILSMRQQLLDIQQNSDEKTIIGKLHRQIIRLQVSEGAAVRKYEQAKKRILSLEAHVLRLEEVIDDKEETFSHKQVEHRVNVKNLKKTIQSLRQNFSGALPLRQVERLSKSTAELQSNRAQLQSDLKKAQDDKAHVEDRLAELQLKYDGVNELLCTLQDGTGAQKVAEWHQKMEGLRLEELKHKRLISKLKQKCQYLDEVVGEHEKNIQALEEENVKMTRDGEERQLLWEQREIKLEGKIDQLEKNQAKITSAAASFTAVSDALPDANMPVPQQLDVAVTTIKKNVKTILDVQAENNNYKKKHVEMTEKLKRVERDLLTKDRIIAEMRLRMPANTDREGIMKLLVDAANSVEEPEDLHANSSALKIAQSTISSLQARIAQKEESIAKYQELLDQARNDLNVANKRHDEEMQLIQEKLRTQSESAFSRFKQISQEILHQPTSGMMPKQQAARLRELEDVVCQQDNSMAALAQKLKLSRQEALQWQRKYDELMVEYEQDKSDLVAASGKLEQDSREAQTRLETRVRDLTDQNAQLEKDIQIQKSMNERAPTVAMRKLVDKLKNQLALKEKQHEALTKALTDVRSDMLHQAEAYVIASNQGAESENNVQKLISKQTDQLHKELTEAKNEISKLNKSVNRHQASEAELRKKASDLQNSLHKKGKQLQQLQADKQRLEQENLDLDNRVQRLKSSRLGKTNVADPNKAELERLRRTVTSLEAELKRKRDEAEKPYEREQAVTRWEENKVMQKTLNQLKNQIRDNQAEINDLKKQLELTKKALITANKDKQTLQNRLRAKKPESGPDKFDVRESFAKETAVDNMASSVHFMPVSGVNESVSDPDASARIRKLQEENMELRFERETLRKDVPRLKSRIQDLHDYIEVLRTENADLKGTSRSLSASGTGGSMGSSIRRLGESGKSTRELEKTIVLLKKVIERLQLDNERLKQSPGVLKNDEVDNIRLENEGLKNQLSELREKFGASLSTRYESSQQAVVRMREEYDKIRKDLRKEVEVNQKLRMENRRLEISTEQMKNEVTIMKSKLEIKEGSQKVTDGLFPGNNPLAVRLLEDRVKTLLVDNNKQSDLIDHMKELLKESSEREQKFKYENLLLKDKLSGVVPAQDTGTDHPLVSDQGVDSLLHEVVELQLENKQLLLDKTRLQDDIHKLKKQNQDQFDMEAVERLKFSYEQLLLQNEQYEHKLQQVQQQFGITL